MQRQSVDQSHCFPWLHWQEAGERSQVRCIMFSCSALGEENSFQNFIFPLRMLFHAFQILPALLYNLSILSSIF